MTRLKTAKLKIIRGFPTFGPRPEKGGPDDQISIRQIVRGSQMAVHTGLTTDAIVTAQLVDQAIALAFELQDLPQATDFTDVFDQYRLDKVKVYIVPQENVSNATSAVGSQGINPLAVVVDLDDSTALGSYNAALQYDQIQLAQPFEGVSVDLLPAVAPAYYQVGAFAGYGVAPGKQWLDAASPAIRHYGVKAYILASGTTTSNASWQVYAEYFVSFRNVR